MPKTTLKPRSEQSLSAHLREIAAFLKDVYQEWNQDHPELLAAGLGYFMLFSIPPLMIIAATALGYFFKDVNPGAVIEKLAPVIGSDAALSVTEWLKVSADQEKGKATILSLLVIWLGASRVFVQLRETLNIIWHVPPRNRNFWKDLVRTGYRKILVVLGVAIFVLMVFMVDTVLALMNKTLGNYFPQLGTIHFWQGVSLVLSFFLLAVGIAAIYRYVPDTSIKWKDVWPGALITAMLLTFGKMFISAYIGMQSLSTAYGAAGSVIVLMIWIYFAAQIFFFGAKITWLYSHRYGSLA